MKATIIRGLLVVLVLGCRGSDRGEPLPPREPAGPTAPQSPAEGTLTALETFGQGTAGSGDPRRAPATEPSPPTARANLPPTDRLAWSFLYDDAGQLAQVSDPAGRKSTFQYQLDQQRVQTVTRQLPDGRQIVRRFSGFGRCTEMSDSVGTVRYQYDGYGRLVSAQRGKMPSITYAYDTQDRLKTLCVGGQWTVTYAYDFLGRLAQMKTPAGRIGYEYLPGQRKVIRTLPNGIRTVWEHRPDGKLGEIAHVAANDRILCQFEYDYRPDGLLARIKQWTPQQEKLIEYQYDSLHRLTVESDSQRGRTEYRYDQFGNRTDARAPGQPAVSASYDWAGRMVQLDGQPCTHDAAGNLTSYAVGKEKRRAQFDARNLLRSAEGRQGPVQYQYDGADCLISRQVGEKQTTYLQDPRAENWRPLLAGEPDGKQTLYVWEGDVPLAAIEGKTVRFFLHDRLGSVRCHADQEGKIVERIDYGPFGEPPQEAGGNVLQPGFAGLFYDPLALLYLTQARAYDPRLGRFLQRDPEGLIAVSSYDLSSYAYCAGDPVNFRDATGNERVAVQYNYAWGLVSNFFVQLPKTISEGTKGVVDFWKPSNIAAGFRGGWELGRPSPGTWADQAERYGGPVARDLVQGILLHTLLTEVDIALGGSLPKTYIPLGKVGHLGVGEKAYYGAPHLGLMQRAMAGSTQTKAVFHLYGAKAFVHLGEVGFSIPYSLVALVPRSGDREPGAQGNPFLLRSDQRDSYAGGPPGGPPGGGGGGGFGGGPAGGGFSPLFPTNVGGVWLQGASKTIADLGPLVGVAIDDNGRLLLLAEDGRTIALPPLRLDDVVTVFRTVYLHRRAPWVSLDPDPKDPEGPVMLTTHAEGTADTYVLWVLFESDRVMKGYSLGYDNLTRQPITSQVADYQKLFGKELAGHAGQWWERFWIVPGEVDRRVSPQGRAVLLDVPLKVCTEVMVYRNGELVSAPERASSKEAQQFVAWFNKHYDEIASEAMYQPPQQSGHRGPVPVFAELRRIALLTAVAESLRDQGVPLPAWMRDYPVAACPVPPNTPAMVVQQTDQGKTEVFDHRAWRAPPPQGVNVRRIYGGVRLWPNDNAVRTTPADPQAAALLPVATGATATAPPLTAAKFTFQGKPHRAVALPGSDTRALGACRLAEEDLVVPVRRGTALRLVRYYHSFFQPAGEFGASWTFDLPRLSEQWTPVERAGDSVKVRRTYGLSSPLSSVSVTFRKADTDGRRLLPDRPGPIAYLATIKDRRIGSETQVARFHDGRCWYFDDAGNLAAAEDAGLLILYRRDQAGRLRQIVGLYGDQPCADIRLEYDAQGRLLAAAGSNGQKVEYLYGTAAAMESVRGPGGSLRYAYQQGLLCRREAGGAWREFEYAAGGQLRREKRSDGTETTYDVRQTAQGSEIVASAAGGVEAARFDPAFRPVQHVFPDGTQVDWTRQDSGAEQITAAVPDGERVTVSRSADGRSQQWRLPEGGTLELKHDAAGRLASLDQSGETVLCREYHPDGRLRRVLLESAAIWPEYGESGAVERLLWTAPGEESPFSQWLAVELDDAGRPARVTDHSGLDLKLLYDQHDRLLGYASAYEGKPNGAVQWTPNAAGELEGVDASWGYRRHDTFAPDGQRQSTQIGVGTAKAAVEYQQGRPAVIRGFDQGEFRIEYHAEGPARGLVRQLTTPGQSTLKFSYDPQNRLSGVSYGGVYRSELRYDGQGRLASIEYTPEHVPVIPPPRVAGDLQVILARHQGNRLVFEGFDGGGVTVDGVSDAALDPAMAPKHLQPELGKGVVPAITQGGRRTVLIHPEALDKPQTLTVQLSIQTSLGREKIGVVSTRPGDQQNAMKRLATAAGLRVIKDSESNIGVLVEKDTFTPEQKPHVDGWIFPGGLRKGTSPEIVVQFAENCPRLHEGLQSRGKSGGFRGKQVVCLFCQDAGVEGAAGVADRLIDHGAVEVIGFNTTFDIRAGMLLIDELSHVVEQARVQGRKPSIHEAMLESLNRCLENAKETRGTYPQWQKQFEHLRDAMFRRAETRPRRTWPNTGPSAPQPC